MDCVYDERMLDMVPIWRDKGINKEPKDGLCLWRKNVRYGTDLERQRNKQRAEGWTVSMTKECYKEPKDGLCLWRKNVRYGTDLERQRNKQRAEGWTMSMTKADEKTIESAELWTMDQLDWELRSKYFERAEHHQTPRGSTRSCCAAQALLIWPYNKRRRVRTIIKCVIQGEVHGKRQRGRRKSNMTPRNGNNAKWIGENVEEIMGGWSSFLTGPRKKKKTELKSKQRHRVPHFAWFNSSRLFKLIQRDYQKISNDPPRTGTKFVGAQKAGISIYADGDFGEMKKTETPSKSRRVGMYADDDLWKIRNSWHRYCKTRSHNIAYDLSNVHDIG